MAKRPQVQDLQTSTVVSPTANVVDTYVRPVEQPTMASPLSQFVAAITPSIQQFSEEKRVEKLKRDQEEENLLKYRKQKQIENQLTIASTQIENSLEADKEVWNSLDASEASEKINSHFNKYITTLQDKNVDPLQVERAKIASENAATALFLAFDTNKKAYQITVDNDDFVKVLSVLNNTQVKDEAAEKAQIKLIQDHINNSALAFPTSDGKPDYKRFIDLAHKYKLDISGNTADTYLYAALETMTKEDGTPANVMDTRDRAAGTAKIRARVENERATAVIEQAKGIAVSNAVDKVFSTQTSSPMNNVQHVNKSGGTSTVSALEMEQAVLTDPRFTNLPVGEQYAFLAKTGITPTVYKNTVNDTLKLIKSGSDISTETDILKIERGFKQWEAMVGSGMDLSFINEDDMYRFKALRYFLQQKANVGEVSVTQITSKVRVGYMGETGTQETQRTIQDYGSAGLMARELNMEYDITSEDLNKISAKLEDTPWFTESHAGTFNSHQVIQDVAFGAKVLFRTGKYATIEDAIDDAVGIANDDYHVVESGDGTQYSFMSLSTDMEKTSQLIQYVNEANQSIQTKIAPEMMRRYSLGPDNYVVAVVPHPTNPKALRLEAWKKDGDTYSYFKPLINQFDKQKFLTNPEYLDKLLVNMEQEEGSGIQIVNNNNISEELNAAVNEVPNVNFFGGSIGRPRPDEPADTGVLPMLSGDAWLDQLSSLANTARLTTDSNPILNWLNENPPLFDVDGKQSVFNQAVDIIVEAAKGDKFEKREIDNALTRMFSDTSTLAQDALGSVTDMLNEAAKKEKPSTMPNIFEEFPASKAFEDIGQEVKDVISNLGVSKANAAVTIISDEGFSNVQYDDMGKNSVGHGLQVESLEADERALIKDINNVQPDESAAVVALKVDKINNYFSNVVEGFENLPDKARSSIIQMGYQLGQFNVNKEWPKFMESVKEAAKATQGSVEQAAALASAKFNMLYNVAENGTVTATKWSTQTADRAMRVAEGMVTDAGKVIGDNLEAAGSAIVNAIIPAAEASDLQPAIIGEEPKAEAVVTIAGAKNPADVASEYLGMSENTSEGAAAVKGFFENVVGNWNPDNQSVEEFATSKAWCAAFLTQVLRDSGVDTKALLGADKFNQVRAAAYLKAGDAVEAPQVKAGDIMIKMHSPEERKKYKLGVAHVGIVASVDGDTVYFIGGNTGDKVELSDYNMTEKDVRFRRINGVTDLPTESLPSMLQLKAGKLGRKSMNKLTNGFNSLYEMVLGD